MPTQPDMPPRGAKDNIETEALLRGPSKSRPYLEDTGAVRAGACLIALLFATGLSTAVLYFTGLTQCWMLLGGADPAAWWNDAAENQDPNPGPGPQSINCTTCISAAPLVFQGCPFGEIGFYVLAGFAAAVPNFILCAVLVALCAARSKIAEVGQRPFRHIRGSLSPPSSAQ